MTMSDGQQICERMWDYVYGLLSEEESQEMVARIKSDPQIARLYAEVRLKGELVAQAALVEDSSLQLKAGADDQPTATRKQTASITPTSTFWHRRATQLIAVAACGLIVVLGTGLCWPRPNAQVLARNFVATDVIVPLALPGGLTNSLAVHTYHINPAGEAAENASTEVQLRLIDSSGKEQFQKTLRTDNSGQANVEIPGAALEPGSRLEVNPVRVNTQGQSLALNSELPVEPEPEISYFLSREPVAEPLAGAGVSTWNFNAFSAKPISEGQSEVAAAGGELRLRDGEQARGGAIANGYQQPYANRAAGRILAGQVPAKPLAKQEAAAAPPQVVEAGQPVQVDIPPELSDKLVDVTVLCRGVTVAATSENEAAAKGSSLDEARLADRRAKIGQRQVAVPLPPEVDGLMEVEIYDQSSDEPLQRNLVYRQPLRKLVVQIPNLQNRVAPGDDIELKLHVVDEKGNSASNTRVGVRVWNEPLVQQLGDRPLLLTDAVLKGQGFDYAQNAQNAVNQVNQQSDFGRLKQQARSYQRSMRAAPAATAVNVPVNAPAEGAPAAGAVATDRRRNESQQIASAQPLPPTKIELASNRDRVTLAIRDAADKSAAKRERAMRILGATAVLGGIAVLLFAAAVAATKIAASARIFVAPLVTAMASLLVGVSWLGVLRHDSPPTIAMAAPAASKSAPASDMAAAPLPENLRRESQPQPSGGPDPLATPPQATPTTNSFSSTPAGAPRSAEPESLRLAPHSPGAAGGMPGGFGASASAGMPPRVLAAADTKKAAEAEKKDADKDSNSSATPPSIYFDANLTTDENGNATIRFTMPSVPCEYRLLIDALGHGRIGSRQELIAAGGK